MLEFGITRVATFVLERSASPSIRTCLLTPFSISSTPSSIPLVLVPVLVPVLVLVHVLVLVLDHTFLRLSMLLVVGGAGAGGVSLLLIVVAW